MRFCVLACGSYRHQKKHSAMLKIVYSNAANHFVCNATWTGVMCSLEHILAGVLHSPTIHATHDMATSSVAILPPFSVHVSGDTQGKIVMALVAGMPIAWRGSRASSAVRSPCGSLAFTRSASHRLPHPIVWCTNKALYPFRLCRMLALLNFCIIMGDLGMKYWSVIEVTPLQWFVSVNRKFRWDLCPCCFNHFFLPEVYLSSYQLTHHYRVD